MLENFHPLFLLEFLLFNGVVLAWLGYEYWKVRPRKDDGSSNPTGHADGEHQPDDR